jgi:translation initiation factor IF-1
MAKSYIDNELTDIMKEVKEALSKTKVKIEFENKYEIICKKTDKTKLHDKLKKYIDDIDFKISIYTTKGHTYIRQNYQ